jgi:hypothetical protein
MIVCDHIQKNSTNSDARVRSYFGRVFSLYIQASMIVLYIYFYITSDRNISYENCANKTTVLNKFIQEFCLYINIELNSKCLFQ